MLSNSDIYTAQIVSKLGGIHAAAKQLHKTQSAISQAVKRLEETVGFTLFDRSGYRINLTKEGKAFLLQSETLMNNEVTLREYAQVLQKGVEASIRVAVWPMVGEEILLPALEKINEQYPDTSVSVDYVESFGSVELLLQHKVDIALTTFSRTERNFQPIEAAVIGNISYINVISPCLLKEHNADSVSRSQLAKWTQITLRSWVNDQIYSFGEKRYRHRWTVNDQRIMLSLILRGVGWGLVPEPSIKEYLDSGKLVALNLPEFGSRINSFYVVAKIRSRLLGPAATTLWEELIYGREEG